MGKHKIVSTVKGVKSEHEFETPGNLAVIVHQHGIRVDVPDLVEINPHGTVKCVQDLNQAQWEWMSTGGVFKVLWDLAFHDSDVALPENVEDIKQEDMGLQHIAGMIIMGCEAFWAGKSVFIRNPETYCHPKTELCLVTMFYAMLRMCGTRGVVTDEQGKKQDDELGTDTFRDAADSYTEESIRKAIERVTGQKPEKPENAPTPEQMQERESEDEVRVTKLWLEAMGKSKGLDADFAKLGETVLSIRQCIRNVEEQTSAGRQLVRKYIDAFRPKPPEVKPNEQPDQPQAEADD